MQILRATPRANF